MEQKTMGLSPELLAAVQAFHLPRYHEITNVGLYLEQAARFVNLYLAPIGCEGLTPSMVSNYVKQKTIPRPVKKAYSAEALAHLLVVAVLKNAASMEDIRLLLGVQRSVCPTPEAYDSFCGEFEGILRAVFRLGALPPAPPPEEASKCLLRTALLACAQKLYLDATMRALRQELAGG